MKFVDVFEKSMHYRILSPKVTIKKKNAVLYAYGIEYHTLCIVELYCFSSFYESHISIHLTVNEKISAILFSTSNMTTERISLFLLASSCHTLLKSMETKCNNCGSETHDYGIYV